MKSILIVLGLTGVAVAVLLIRASAKVDDLLNDNDYPREQDRVMY